MRTRRLIMSYPQPILIMSYPPTRTLGIVLNPKKPNKLRIIWERRLRSREFFSLRPRKPRKKSHKTARTRKCIHKNHGRKATAIRENELERRNERENRKRSPRIMLNRKQRNQEFRRGPRYENGGNEIRRGSEGDTKPGSMVWVLQL